MSHIPSNRPNPYQPPMPNAGHQQGFPQPVVHRPGSYHPGMPPGGVMPPDSYRPGMPPTAPPGRRPPMGRPGAPVAMPEPQVEYVSRKDVAFGLLGAAAGYFALPALGLATGPIGALVLGIALLGMSAISRAVSRSKAAKNPQQPPGQMPPPPVYPQRNQQPVYENKYDYQMDPNQQNDPRYRQPPPYRR